MLNFTFTLLLLSYNYNPYKDWIILAWLIGVVCSRPIISDWLTYNNETLYAGLPQYTIY